MTKSLAMALLFLAVPVAAQSRPPSELERRAAVGRTFDRDGKPWAGAEVHLHARQVMDAPGAGWVDEVIVKSRDSGKFTARLLRGVFYSGYAVQEVDGGVRVSHIRQWVWAGQPIEFRERRTNRRASYRLEGQDAWAKQGPLLFELSQSECQYAPKVLGVLDGRIRIPPLAGDWAVIRIMDAKRRHITTRSVALDPLRPVGELALLPPFQIRYRAIQAKTAKPWVGARVLRQTFRGFEPLGVTDADGRLEFWVQRHPKIQKAPAAARILVLDEGQSESMIPIFTDLPVLDARIDARDATGLDLVHEARLRPSLRGQLIGLDGKPMASTRMILRFDLIPIRKRVELNDWVRLPREHRTDADGRFVIPMPDEFPKSRSHLLGLSVVQGTRETLILAEEASVLDASRVHDIRMANLAKVSIRIHGQDEGKPVVCHYLPIGPDGWKTLIHPLHLLARGRGKIDLRLPPGRYHFALESPGHFLHKDVRVDASQKNVDLEFTFPETRRIRGRILQADGRPAVNADLRWSPLLLRGRRLRSRYRSPAAQSLVFNRVTLTDQGLFEFLLPADAGEFQLSARWVRPGDTTFHSPLLYRLSEGSQDVLDLQLRFGKR